MKADPFSGDIARMKGKRQGFRRRVGSWRLIFELEQANRLVLVHDILRRTSTTYLGGQKLAGSHEPNTVPSARNDTGNDDST